MDSNMERGGGETGPDEELGKHPELQRRLKALFQEIEDNSPEPGGSTGSAITDTAPDDPRRIMGDFRIIREIGSGGMARVYEAEQLSIKRRVALKVLPPHLTLSQRSVLRFQREGEAAGRQSHPAIVSIFAVGQHEDVYYIAQELVEGGFTLADRLEELRRAGGPEKGHSRWAAELIAEVGDALQHAHSSGVVHRDVKPSNILLTPEGHPKVTDFGLARIEDRLVFSRSGELTGTPFYMSPEQAMSRRIGIDHRTDIFSLGVTLYEALTLVRPFEGETSHEVMKKIILMEPPRPHKITAHVPRDLEVICLKAMEKDPVRRYQSMAEFSEDLRRFVDDRVILAKPASLGYRTWKRVKRNPVVSAAVAVAAVALLLLVFVAPWIIARNERVEAARTRAVKEFLEMVLVSPDPYRGLGRETRMVDVLDHAAKELPSSLPDQPEIEAYLHFKIARTYYGLGEYEKAEAEVQPALALRRRHLGEKHPDTLATRSLQALLFTHRDSLDDAAALNEELLELRAEILGQEHQDTLESMNNLATVYGELGRNADAEPLLQRVVRIRTTRPFLR